MTREYMVVYQAIEDGSIMATVQTTGAVTQGRTMKEAREMIKEAVVLESYWEHAAKETPARSMVCGATIRSTEFTRPAGTPDVAKPNPCSVPEADQAIHVIL